MAIRCWISAAIWLSGAAFIVSASPAPPTNRSLDADCAASNATLAPLEHPSAYPLTLSFTGSRGQLAGGEIITLSHGDGADPITLTCSSPVVHALVPAGRYMADVDLDGFHKVVQFTVALSKGTQNVEVQFPEVVG